MTTTGTGGFAIICDARKGHHRGIDTLALVDRGKTRKLWWTSDEASLILRYRSSEAARFAASRLRKNNPLVVTYGEACEIIERQANELIRQEADDDQSWDAHKCG